MRLHPTLCAQALCRACLGANKPSVIEREEVERGESHWLVRGRGVPRDLADVVLMHVLFRVLRPLGHVISCEMKPGDERHGRGLKGSREADECAEGMRAVKRCKRTAGGVEEEEEEEEAVPTFLREEVSGNHTGPRGVGWEVGGHREALLRGQKGDEDSVATVELVVRTFFPASSLKACSGDMLSLACSLW
jgi:hypothetical protein